jgi:hypothetical protein
MFYIIYNKSEPSTPGRQAAWITDEQSDSVMVLLCVHSVASRTPSKTIQVRYPKDTLEYEYRVKTVALGTLKQYSILSLTLYLEEYSAYSTVGSGEPH